MIWVKLRSHLTKLIVYAGDAAVCPYFTTERFQDEDGQDYLTAIQFSRDKELSRSDAADLAAILRR